MDSKKKKKMIQANIYETERDSETLKTNLWLLKGKRGEGIN